MAIWRGPCALHGARNGTDRVPCRLVLNEASRRRVVKRAVLIERLATH